MAQSPGWVTARAIAASTAVPARYQAKVLQLLVDARLAVSRRGPRGGFRLSRSPGAITLLEVVRAIDPAKHADPNGQGDDPHQEQTPLHNLLTDLAGATDRRLSEITLDDLAHTR